MSQDNPFAGLGGDEEPNPFASLGAPNPLEQASQPGASPSSSSWWDAIWRAPEFVMKPVRKVAEFITEPAAGARNDAPGGLATTAAFAGLGVPQPALEAFFGTPTPSFEQIKAAGKGAVAGGLEGAAENFLSPGNIALMLISGGTSAAGANARNAGSLSRGLVEVLQNAGQGPESAKAILTALKEAEKAYGAARFWTNLGAGAETIAGAGMAAHGAPTLYQGIKERDLSKVASGIFELTFGAMGAAGGRGRFLPGGPPGPGRPRKFFEGGATGDEGIGPPSPFAGLGEEVAAAGDVGGPPAGVEPPAVVAAAAKPVGAGLADAAGAAAPEVLPGGERAAAPTIEPVAPTVIAPTPFDQPTGLPAHIAPSIQPLATDLIESPALRLKAEELAGKLAQGSREEAASVRVSHELLPYRAEIQQLSDDLRTSYAYGRGALADAQTTDAKLASELPDGIWHYEPIAGYTKVLQVHKGKIVGVGEAVEGKIAAIAGGKGLGSPVSSGPLYEYMRAKFEPDTLVTAAGELTRRRKIRSYIEEQNRNATAQAAPEGQAAAGEHDLSGTQVRPVDAQGRAPEGGGPTGGFEGLGAGEVAAGAGGEPVQPVAAGAGGAAGGPPAEGLGGAAAGAADSAGPPGSPETVGALALDSAGGGPPGSAAAGIPPGGEHLPKYAGAINLWRVQETAGDDVAKVILETYQAHEPLIQSAQRGHIPIAEQQTMADDLGLKLKDILQTTPGSAKPAEWLRASHQALTESAGLVWELAAKYNPRDADSKATLMRALASHVALQAKVSGVRSEAGRALGTLAYLNKVEKAGDAGALQTVIEQHGGDAQLDLIADLLGKITPEDVRAVNQFASRAIVPTTLDKVYEYWLNAILSGPPTHAANILSNTVMVLEKPIETLLQAGAAHAASAATGKPRQVYYGEAAHEAIGIARGFREGVGAALQAWATERPVFGVNQVSETQGPVGAISGTPGKVIRSFGTRALTASDEFFKAVIHRMALNGRAYSLAVEHAGKGADRATIAQRMAEILADPPQTLLRAAEKEALYRTFNKEPGAVGRAALALRRDLPGVRWVIPFVRTPVNIVEFGGERLAHPGKLYTYGKALADYKAGKIDTRKLSEESAHALIGLTTAIGVGALVAEGRITGGGPTDPGERRTAALALTGTSDYPAYSAKFGGNWYSYSRLEPLGITLGMTADFIELNRLKDIDEVPSRFMAAFRKNFGDKTWVSGLTGLFKAYSDEERYGKAWTMRTISSFVPNLFGTAARAIDPTRRLPEDIPSAIQSKIPGLTEGAPPALDPFGRPEVNPLTAGERMFSPVMRRSTQGDPVAQKLMELDVNIDVPSKKISESVLKELNVSRLPPEQLYLIRQARGLEVYGRLQQLLTPDFYQLTLPDQKRFIERTISDARADVSKRARGLLLGREPFTLTELTLFPNLGGPPAQ